MTEMILLKLGELVLKGANRHTFEDKLKSNIARRLRPLGKFRVYTRQSTTYVEPLSDTCDMDAAYEAMKHVFGVVGISRAKACEKTREAMLETARSYLGDKLSAAHTFKVESKRADKSFPMTSIALSQWVGGELDDLYPNLQVDVHQPELTVHLEVRDYAAFVHADPEPGAGGLPVGTSGRALSLLSGGIDSPVASWMMAKRGVALEMVHFYSYPYTSPEAREKVLELARLLTPWCGRLTPLLSGGLLHPPHAPVHDAHRGGGGPAHGLPRRGHRRVPGTGGLPDHGRHGRHRGRHRASHLPAPGGDGQGGGGPHRAEDRHLRDLHRAL